jgi:hypothetical protein
VVAGEPALLGGEGGRVIALRLSELRSELSGKLGDELGALLDEGVRRPLEQFAAAERAS